MEEIFKKYLDNQCSPEEVRTLLTYFDNPEDEVQLRALIYDGLESIETDTDESQWQPATDKIFARIQPQLQTGNGKIVPLFRRPWVRIAAAAVLAIGIFSIYNYFIRPGTTKPEIVNTDPVSNEVVPGGNKAILTLADGSSVNLTNTVNDTVAKQGSTNIIKVADGQLSYRILNEKPTNGLYNSIATPRGGQYQLTLSDGTMIWLNAASSVHFPVVFTGSERVVEITGEVYFEVAKNASMPFKVKIANKAEIEVLGTHFNVNAYVDEPSLNTTLLEGKVKVTSTVAGSRLPTPDSRLLSPGEQAQLKTDGKINIDKPANAEQYIAWKNGIFSFDSADLEMSLRQLARWYDIEIEFEGSTARKKFSGEMQRNLSISQVIKLLETNNVHCRLEGRKLIVQK